MILDSFEVTLAHRTIWGEARGEGPDGMKAVGHVLLNRLKDGRWGSMLGEVCLAPYQFSCWNVGDPNRIHMIAFAVEGIELQPMAFAFTAARAEHEQGIDATNGATHYFVADMLNPPNWASGHQPCAVIGHHSFYKGIP